MISYFKNLLDSAVVPSSIGTLNDLIPAVEALSLAASDSASEAGGSLLLSV